MILWSNGGLSPRQIAKRVRFSRYTVGHYIQRYEAAGLAGLFTKPRSGRPRRVTQMAKQLLLMILGIPVLIFSCHLIER